MLTQWRAVPRVRATELRCADYCAILIDFLRDREIRRDARDARWNSNIRRLITRQRA